MISVIFLSMIIKRTAGIMFDFHFRNAAHNSTTHEMLCKEMGYDGLAVISAPEAYHYTIHVSEYHR